MYVTSVAVAAGLLLLACGGSAATGAGGAGAGAGTCAARWSPSVRTARAFASRRRGFVGFSVHARGRSWGWHAGQAVPMASVFKALLLVTYLRRPGTRDRPLTRTDHRLLDPMIRRSDNAAATRVNAIVGSARVRAVGRLAGLRTLHVVTSPWGDSAMDAADGARLFGALERLLPPRHRGDALHLLATVVPAQRWGIGRVPLPAGWRAFFKGGWGSGTGRVDHQAVLLRARCGAEVSLAVMTTAQGTHAYGKATLRGVFARLLRHLPRGV